MRRRSLRWAFAIVALIGVVGLVAGVVGTARAMFLSQHDFEVVLVGGRRLPVSCRSVFALVVARQAVRGRGQSQEATRQLGRQRRLRRRPTDLPAELTELSDQLADASQRLAESHERERSLEASRRELVAWVSHDLRTPLAGLRAMAEALEDGMADDPARYHGQMRETVDRMARMVDDLFELSRIHAGHPAARGRGGAARRGDQRGAGRRAVRSRRRAACGSAGTPSRGSRCAPTRAS